MLWNICILGSMTITCMPNTFNFLVYGAPTLVNRVEGEAVRMVGLNDYNLIPPHPSHSHPGLVRVGGGEGLFIQSWWLCVTYGRQVLNGYYLWLAHFA
jgi:hypothetical protein